MVDFTQPGLAEADSAAFASLTRLVDACQHDGWQTMANTALVAGSLWAAVHGLSQLWLFGVLQAPTGTTDIDEVSDTTFALLLNSPVATSTTPSRRR